MRRAETLGAHHAWGIGASGHDSGVRSDPMKTFTVTIHDVPDDWTPTGDVVLIFRAIRSDTEEGSDAMQYGLRAIGPVRRDLALGCGMAEMLYRDYSIQAYQSTAPVDDDDEG